MIVGSVLVLQTQMTTGQAADTAPAPALGLSPGQTGTVWQGTLETGDAAERLRLGVAPGTYVAGRLEAESGPLVLDLVGTQGRHIRRLVGADGFRDTFQFLMPEGESFLTIRRARDGGDIPTAFRVEITQNVVPGDLENEDTPAPLLSPRLRRLQAELASGAGTEDFWEDIADAGTPLVEPLGNGNSIVTFVYRNARTGVRILGAPSADHDPMVRLEGSDVWYRSYELPDETRLSYRLAPDVPVVPGSFWQRRVAILATAQADPLNRRPWPEDAIERFSRKSVLELPGAPEQPYVDRSPVNPGSVKHVDFASERLGNTRTVSFYMPTGFDPSDPETVLLVIFDGSAYQSDVSVPAILDNMQADGVIPQTAAVLISNPDLETRGRELPGDPAFAEVVAGEILPLAARELGVSVPAKRTALAGSSYGGLASTRLALAWPQVFGNVISLSGSYWWSPDGAETGRAEHMANLVAGMERANVRFFLTAGLFETGRAGELDILNTNRHLRTVMEAKGYDVTLREYAGAHDYITWRGALSDGLIHLFGK